MPRMHLQQTTARIRAVFVCVAIIAGLLAHPALRARAISSDLRPNTVVLQQAGAIFTVNSSADPGDGLCDATECTLREALTAANNSPGADAINFNIAAPGPHTISPLTALPTISETLTIDGYSQPGAGANTLATGSDAVLQIVLSGANVTGADGLTIEGTADGSIIRGLVINNGFGRGIAVNGADGTVIQGNYIGVDAAGAAALANGAFGLSDAGIYIADATNTQIGGNEPAARNVIAGNNGDGIALWNTFPPYNQASGTLIQGNYIGVGADGATALANGGSGGGFGLVGGGITLRNFIANTTITGNLVANNVPDGIVDFSGSNTLIQGNTVVDNGDNGVELGGSGHTIGGNKAAARNLISGNGSHGISISGLGTSNNSVIGNYIGVTADGLSGQGNGGDGIRINSAFSTTIRNNLIAANAGNGVQVEELVSTSGLIVSNRIGSNANGAPLGNNGAGILINDGQSYVIGSLNAGEGNLIAYNGGGGVVLTGDGQGNIVRGNQIYDNGGLGLDLGASGVTANDAGDGDTGANGLLNFPLLTGIAGDAGGTVVNGSYSGAPNGFVVVDLYASAGCDPSGNGEGAAYLGSGNLNLDSSGNGNFVIPLGPVFLGGQFVTATAIDTAGNTSEFSACVAAQANDSWQTALSLPRPVENPAFTISTGQYLLRQDQAAWFRLDVDPNAQLRITLTGLPADYDLTLYDDIAAARERVSQVRDPLAYSVQIAQLDIGQFDIGQLDIGQLDIGRLDIGDGSAASAQVTSLRAISALPGTAGELIVRNTWNNGGDIYIRVRGKNGVFSAAAPFRLTVSHESNSCAGVAPISGEQQLPGTAGGYETVIVANLANMATTASGALAEVERAALVSRLSDLAGVTNGVIIDLSERTGPGPDDWRYPRVQAALAQAAGAPNCPYAMNLAAGEIKALIDSYRADNNLQYVVLIGSDNDVPFFRFPDQSGVDGGSQRDLKTSLLANSRSDAALKGNYLLNQDYYGVAPNTEIVRGGLHFLSPDLAVGRLVETAWETSRMIDAYLATFDDDPATPDGALRPDTALLTGYDFFNDARAAIEQQFAEGINAPGCTTGCYQPEVLAAPPDWSNTQLRQRLFGAQGFDLLFIGAHASPDSALAADYNLADLLRSREVADRGDFFGSILMTIGCNFGFNLPNNDAIGAGNDWAQDFNARGATVIAATGYQFGETEYIEYNERFYLELARTMRRPGSGPVPIGEAFLAAKARYAATLGVLDGVHEKVLLTTALYGLPMYGVDMRSRVDLPEPASVVGAGDLVDLGMLAYADLTVTPTLTLTSESVPTPDGSNLVVSNFAGPDGAIQALPAEPVLPLNRYRVDVDGRVVRGVGFRGGVYDETGGLRPRTGAIAIEQSSFVPPFASSILYPSRWWSNNFFAALYGGPTWLNLTPAQFISESAGSTIGKWRSFSQDVGLRIFYVAANRSDPPLAAPQILRVEGRPGPDPGQVTISADVLGDTPEAISQVWATYTAPCAPEATCSGSWQSVDLNRTAGTSQWSASFSPVVPEIVFIVQAVNSDGLVQVVTNSGAFYRVASPSAQPAATRLELSGGPYSSGVWGDTQTVSARLSLSEDGTPLADRVVTLAIGSERVEARTDANGIATAAITLRDLPGPTLLTAIFGGEGPNQPAALEQTYTIEKRPTSLAFTANTPALISIRQGEPTSVQAMLSSNGLPLANRSVFFVGSGATGTFVALSQTDPNGMAQMNPVEWPAGNYTLTAYFGGQVPGFGVALEATYAGAVSAGRGLIVSSAPAAAPIIITAPARTAQVAVPYSYRVGAIGWPRPTYMLMAGPESMAIDSSSGLVLWTPQDVGDVSVTVRAMNSTGMADQRYTLTVVPNQFNDPPVAVDDTATVDYRDTVTIEVLANDSDPDGDSLSVVEVSAPARGTATINLDGTISYTHTDDLVGGNQDSFSYTISDGRGGSASATVTITINRPNRPPVAVDDRASINSRGTVTIAVLANDSDPDGDSLSVTAVSTPARGTATINGDGTISYTHTDNLVGGNQDSFSYTISDGRGGSASAIVTITIKRDFVCPSLRDNFNRSDGAIRTGGKPWYGPEGLGGYSIRGYRVQVFGGGPIYWKGARFGAGQAACLKLTRVDTRGDDQGLILKVQGETPNWRNGAISVSYLANRGEVRVDTFQRHNPGPAAFDHWRHYKPIKVTFRSGDVLGAVARADGTVSIYKNGRLIGAIDTRGRSLDRHGRATYSGNGNYFVNRGGYTGIWYLRASRAKFDDFQAGNVGN